MTIADVRHLMTDNGAGRYALDPAAVIGVAAHHSVTWASFAYALNRTSAEETAHLQVIDAYHHSLGWNGFGYHMAAFPSARAYLCGALDGARAHVASRNHELIGVVLIGDFTTDPPQAPQLAAGARCVAAIRGAYPRRPLHGHREWALPAYATACPGDTWPGWLRPLDQDQEASDMMDPTQAAQLQRIHDWLFDPTGFTDPLAPRPGGPANRAEWLNALFYSMDTWHHFQGVRTRLAEAGAALRAGDP